MRKKKFINFRCANYYYYYRYSGGQNTRRGLEDDARIRRATEREGRRARRRRARELTPTLPKHIDGMSSDDEVTEQQNLAFKQAKGLDFLFTLQFFINFIKRKKK